MGDTVSGGIFVLALLHHLLAVNAIPRKINLFKARKTLLSIIFHGDWSRLSPAQVSTIKDLQALVTAKKKSAATQTANPAGPSTALTGQTGIKKLKEALREAKIQLAIATERRDETQALVDLAKEVAAQMRTLAQTDAMQALRCHLGIDSSHSEGAQNESHVVAANSLADHSHAQLLTQTNMLLGGQFIPDFVRQKVIEKEQDVKVKESVLAKVIEQLVKVNKKVKRLNRAIKTGALIRGMKKESL